jgi:hypothetical protein
MTRRKFLKTLEIVLDICAFIGVEAFGVILLALALLAIVFLILTGVDITVHGYSQKSIDIIGLLLSTIGQSGFKITCLSVLFARLGLWFFKSQRPIDLVRTILARLRDDKASDAHTGVCTDGRD